MKDNKYQQYICTCQNVLRFFMTESYMNFINCVALCINDECFFCCCKYHINIFFKIIFHLFVYDL